MLEVRTDDRTDSDRLGEAGLPRAKTADAARYQVDLRAGAGSVVQSVDHLGLDEAVQLQRDPARG
jgi:hypothetical protein